MAILPKSFQRKSTYYCLRLKSSNNYFALPTTSTKQLIKKSSTRMTNSQNPRPRKTYSDLLLSNSQNTNGSEKTLRYSTITFSKYKRLQKNIKIDYYYILKISTAQEIVHINTI